MNRRDAIAGMIGASLGTVCSKVLLADEPNFSAKTKDDIIKLLVDVRQATKFTDSPVPENDVIKILSVGVATHSTHNKQPWFFTAVSDRKLLKSIDEAAKIDPNERLSLTGSPLAIFMSADSSEHGLTDAFLASDRMTVAATILGYGVKTVAYVAGVANQESFKEELQVPEGFRVFGALLIGVEPKRSIDGTTGATKRAPLAEKIAIIEARD